MVKEIRQVTERVMKNQKLINQVIVSLSNSLQYLSLQPTQTIPIFYLLCSLTILTDKEALTK